MPVISVENLSKAYRLGTIGTGTSVLMVHNLYLLNACRELYMSKQE